jgi:hypothetical protein
MNNVSHHSTPGEHDETYVRRVESVDTEVVGGLDLCDTLLLRKNPCLPFGVAVGHAAQDDPGHLQAGLAEADCR